MESHGSASLIVSTYNDLEILEMTLAALARQSDPNCELILADDGSSQDYAPILRQWARHFGAGIKHVTHEKRGFRRARILNRAIEVSRGERLIFLDMDCLPHRDFVRNHLRYGAPDTVITGRRVDLSRQAAPTPSQILERGLGLNPISLLQLGLRGKARRIEHGFVAPLLYESWYKELLGSNFSMGRAEMLEMNGFNEEFEGWGGEDTELYVRLLHKGLHIRNLRNKVVQYHLSHAHREYDHSVIIKKIERTKAEKTVRARIGLAETVPGDFQCFHYKRQGTANEAAREDTAVPANSIRWDF